MAPYYSQHVTTVVLFAVTVGAWVVVELLQSLKHRSNATSRDRGSYFLLIGCLAVGWVLAALSLNFPWAVIAGQAIACYVGLVLAWCGLGLRVWAFRTLGRYFTFRVKTSADQPVISSGPYRVIRHPGYTGILLIMLGLSLNYGTWVAPLAVIVFPTIGLVIRIRVEEQALAADLGEPYRAYAASRKRLIPFIW